MKPRGHARISDSKGPSGHKNGPPNARQPGHCAKRRDTEVWKRAIKPVCGEICWEVDYCRYTNLHLEFGRPRLEVVRGPGGPRNLPAGSRRLQMLRGKRLVAVHGRWRISVAMAYWKILYRGELIATMGSSTRKINLATRLLTGQKLVDVAVDPKNGATTFRFDLGGALAVRRMEAVGSDPVWYVTDREREDYMVVHCDGASRRKSSSEPLFK